MQFHVLGSGSSGNASLVVAGAVGVLVDLGFGPRTLTRRLADIGASWDNVHGAVLTHVHTDHWHENSLRHLERRRLTLHCHPDHVAALRPMSAAFCRLHDTGLVHTYRIGAQCRFDGGLMCRPLPLQHDGGATCGFRFDWDGRSLGYAADLGSWNRTLVEDLIDVDLLALEFNHDVAMEKASGRAAQLIDRVLGEHGHLSNEQAAALLHAVLAASAPGRLRHLVQLHLSRQCNRRDLAHAAASMVRDKAGARFQVHTAHQDQPGPTILVERHALEPAAALGKRQMTLPGWDGD